MTVSLKVTTGRATLGEAGTLSPKNAMNCSVLMRRRTLSWATIRVPAARAEAMSGAFTTMPTRLSWRPWPRVSDFAVACLLLTFDRHARASARRPSRLPLSLKQ